MTRHVIVEEIMMRWGGRIVDLGNKEMDKE